MAFPVVQTKATVGSAGSTSHPITLPTGVTAGDLLLVIFGVRSNPTVSVGSGTGWTKLGQQSQATAQTTAIFYKIATGSDALTLSTTTSQRSTAGTYRITGASGVVEGAGAGATSTNPDTPNLTPAGGAKDYLWISTSSIVIGTVSASAAPASYTNLTNYPSGAGTGISLCIAERGLNATSENPGAFTAASTTWAGYTLAISPTGGGTSYTLTADAGSYSLSGQTANLTSARSVIAAPGSYALTGNDATLVYTGAGVAYSITAEAGSYALTGQVANISSARRILADPGNYSLTGQTANLTSARRITADPGSYSLTGQAANLNIGRRMAADPGSYVLTGNTANFPRLRNMIAAAGSYSLTGQAANLSLGRRLVADPGSYALSGNAATFSRSIRIEAEAGSYVLMGQDVGLNYIPTAGPQVVTFIIG